MSLPKLQRFRSAVANVRELAERFPGVDPEGKYSPVDMKIAQRMAQMLAEKQDLSPEEITGWVERFCKRKWNSEFSREMSRSCTEMVKDWLK